MITRRSPRKMVWSWWHRCCCCGCWFWRAACTKFVEDYSMVCRFELFVFGFCMWRICIWTICMFLLFEGIAYSSTGLWSVVFASSFPPRLIRIWRVGAGSDHPFRLSAVKFSSVPARYCSMSWSVARPCCHISRPLAAVVVFKTFHF